jgi:hypothetical protein
MALKLPKSLGVKVKPVSKWNAGDLATVATGGLNVPTIAATKWAMDTYKGNKSDAKTRDTARDEAARAEAEALGAKYDAERAVGRSPLERIANTTVPGVTAAPLDPRFRDSQVSLLDQLTKTANGQGPSLAQQQFQQAGNTALQKSMGAIRAATGANAALGGRTAALASTNLLGNIAAESGMARLKEQQDAQSALASLAAAGRTGDLQSRQQDIGLGTSNAEIALKNAQVQAAAAGGLLDDTGRVFEGGYNRGAQVAAAKAGKQSAPSILDQLLPIAAGGLVTAAGVPAAAPAAAAATKAATGASLRASEPPAPQGAGLVGQAPQIKKPPFGRPMTRTRGMF